MKIIIREESPDCRDNSFPDPFHNSFFDSFYKGRFSFVVIFSHCIIWYKNNNLFYIIQISQWFGTQISLHKGEIVCSKIENITAATTRTSAATKIISTTTLTKTTATATITTKSTTLAGKSKQYQQP